MEIGTIFYNPERIKGVVRSCDVPKGYYIVTHVGCGYLTSKLKPEDRMVYFVRRCTKDGKRLMSYVNGFNCRVMDERIKEGKVRICGKE